MALTSAPPTDYDLLKPWGFIVDTDPKVKKELFQAYAGDALAPEKQ